MAIAEASITAQEVEMIGVVTEARDRLYLTQFVPNVVPIAKSPSSPMAEKKFSAVNVLRKWVVVSPATPEAQEDLKVEDSEVLVIETGAREAMPTNRCLTLSATSAVTTVPCLLSPETVNRYCVAIVLPKKTEEEVHYLHSRQDLPDRKTILTLSN